MRDADLPLLLATLLLGLRHGIDWDHIAAGADITAARGRARGGFVLGSLYAADHASIIVALGLAAVVVGAHVPDAVDRVMAPVVGVTLSVSGAYILVAFWRHGRWLLLIDGLHALEHRGAASLTRKAVEPRHRAIETYGLRTAFGVGMVDGIGAEAPDGGLAADHGRRRR